MRKLTFSVLLTVPLIFWFSRPARSAQVEHAPTPEQCRADAAAWDIPEHFIFDRDAFSNMVTQHSNESAQILDARRDELQLCEKTDRLHATRYALGGTAYGVAELIRVGDFMRRHNLMQQFYREDDEGKR
ncbi:MAG TPA: hypothetical protein VMB47_18730 [Candidatus Aquilonibacter sp.]|nr:hypothetical protein [Candidatus Aquilonibacter sp.]